MAQMIAKAMANQDRANAEQQAMINRLADEFSNELNNLGVRVARLEDRVGNVKVTGDVRLRYLGSQEKDGKFVNDGTNMRGLDYSKGSQFDVRAHLQFNAKVNDRTDVVVRTTTGNMELGDSFQTSSSGSSLRDRPTNIHFDRAYVNHKFGERVSVKADRFNQMIGNGLIYDDGLTVFNSTQAIISLISKQHMVMVLRVVLLPICMVKTPSIKTETLLWSIQV